MLPGQDEGAADFLVQTLAPSHFPFSVSSFRPGNLVISERFFNRMRPMVFLVFGIRFQSGATEPTVFLVFRVFKVFRVFGVFRVFRVFRV